MKKIKKLLHKNLYLYDLTLRLSFKKYNREMIDFTKRISKIDPIMNYEYFRVVMKEIPKFELKDVYTLKRSFSENLLYGHAFNLLKYAGLSEKNMFYVPVLEHGIPYSSIFDAEKYKLNNTYIFQGKNNKKSWDCKKRTSAYYIGPYIHYCSGIYDNQTILDFKKKNGLTALIFLPHSIETNSFKVNVQKIIDDFKKIKGLEIKTVLACVYCMDATNIQIIDDDSIKFVSAGFKLDNNFIRRLKLILELADIVYYSSFSSSIGYAYYLNKKIICNPTEDDLEELKKMADNSAVEKMLKLQELFGIHSVGNDQLKYDFINKYWGLEEIKTPEEIRMIIKKNRSRIIRHFGF